MKKKKNVVFFYLIDAEEAKPTLIRRPGSGRDEEENGIREINESCGQGEEYKKQKQLIVDNVMLFFSRGR